jgi:hypothetical protein
VRKATATVRLSTKAERPGRPGLSERGALVHLSERLQRRAQAECIAKRWKVDAGDVEHVLFNLTLDPWQRLRKSFKRGGLRRLSAD